MMCDQQPAALFMACELEIDKVMTRQMSTPVHKAQRKR